MKIPGEPIRVLGPSILGGHEHFARGKVKLQTSGDLLNWEGKGTKVGPKVRGAGAHVFKGDQKQARQWRNKDVASRRQNSWDHCRSRGCEGKAGLRQGGHEIFEHCGGPTMTRGRPPGINQQRPKHEK